MIIIYKQDGSIFSKADSDYVQQGSNDVNKIFVAFVDSANQNWSANARFVRANDTETNQVGIPTTFTYNGINYSGWVFNLSSAETYYAGNLRVFISFYDAGGSIKNTYITNIIVNATGYPVDEDVSTPITTAEFNSYMAQIAAKQPLKGMTSVVVETLPPSGVVGVLYFLKGSLTDKVYSQYIWNGSAFVWVGSLVLDTFATLEEQKAFEEELQAEWQEYQDNLNTRFDNYKNSLDLGFETFKQQVNVKVDNALNMTPIPVATVNDLPSGGATQPYVVQENGYWYYWNGSQWVQGQQYQAITGYKTLSLGTLNKAYVDNIVANAGSLCFISLEGKGQDLVDETLSSAIIGDGYAWYESESNKVLLWLHDNVYEVVRNPDSTGNYYLRDFIGASEVPYDNATSGLDATNVQGAIDEVVETNLLYKFDDFSNEIPSDGGSKTINFKSIFNTPSLANKTITLKGNFTVQNGSYRIMIGVLTSDGVDGGNRQFTNNIDCATTKLPAGCNGLNLYIIHNGTTGLVSTFNATNVKLFEGTDDKEIKSLNEVVPHKETIGAEMTTFCEDNKILLYQDVECVGSNIGDPSVKTIVIPSIKNPQKGISVKINDYICEGNYKMRAGIFFYGKGIYDYLGTYALQFMNGDKEWFFIPPTETQFMLIQFYFILPQETYTEYKGTVKGFRVFQGTTAPYSLSIDTEVSFDYRKYTLPVLNLVGATIDMTKDRAVDMTWSFKGQTGSCTCKWQGTSSIAFPKKNYTIKLSEAIDFGFGSQSKYCLKANWVDRTHTKNIVCAKLYADCLMAMPDFETNYPLLATAPNKGAVDGYPICLTINGQYQGIYTFNIPKDGWMMNMGTGNQECIICAENLSGSGFNSSPVLGTDFDLEYATDENDTTWIQTALTNIYNAIQNNDETTLRNLVDFDNVLTYRTFSYMLGNNDGIIKNYLLCKFDNTKWFIMAYDLDCVFGAYFDNFRVLASPTYYSTGNALFDKVHELSSASDVNAVVDRLTGHLTNAPLSIYRVVSKINDFAYQIPTALLNEEVKIWNTLPSTQTDTIDRMNFAYTYRFPFAVDWTKK